MVMSIYTLTDAIVIGQGVGANALAALASGLMAVMPVVEVLVLGWSVVFLKNIKYNTK